MDKAFIEANFIKPAGPVSERQGGRQRMTLPAPVGRIGTGMENPEAYLMGLMSPERVFMMGDNPDLPKMPEKPTLLDFFRNRFDDFTFQHMTTSAKRAMEDCLPEPIILACLLHDISNACLMRADHGYWGAQMIAPYVSEEVAWAVQNHQALRYFADESVGYAYPESYHRFFGPDYVPPDYIQRDAAAARAHRWYMSARQVTMYDVYIFEKAERVDPTIFTDIIGRHFKHPADGLGFDGSPSAHMWRTMIWPNNFL